MPKPFYVHKNKLTDGSVIWEIWQHGTDQRLGSAGDEIAALAFASTLNDACDRFTRSSVENTVDC